MSCNKFARVASRCIFFRLPRVHRLITSNVPSDACRKTRASDLLKLMWYELIYARLTCVKDTTFYRAYSRVGKYGTTTI
jgi:hypothetical protein